MPKDQQARNTVTNLASLTDPYHPVKMRLLLYREGRGKFVWHWLTYWGIGCHTLIHFDGTWTSAQA